jgi:hypothetical protein
VNAIPKRELPDDLRAVIVNALAAALVAAWRRQQDDQRSSAPRAEPDEPEAA